MHSGKLIVQLHNTGSVNQCRDFAKIALGLGARDIIFSKAVGSAATAGIPAAQKMAFSTGANILYLQEIKDAIELCSPDEVYLFIRRPFSDKEFDAKKIAEQYLQGKTILLIFGGSEPGITKKELELGIPVYFSKINEIGCLGEITLALYLLRDFLKKNS
ncbi:MAG: RecB-family nuclease [Candidatus Heimdallarchaeaceae archaeon]